MKQTLGHLTKRTLTVLVETQLKSDHLQSWYPYLYLKNPNSNIFIGHKKHWRQVRESLCTYLISKKILKKKWNNFYKMFTNNHDPYEKELHNIYKKELCFSPMPSLAVHVTNINSVYGISPLLDYFKLWKENNYK